MRAIAGLGLGGDDVVLSDAFDDPALVAAASDAHRHAYAGHEQLERLLHAHRAVRRIVVVARHHPSEVRTLCDGHAAILVPHNDDAAG